MLSPIKMHIGIEKVRQDHKRSCFASLLALPFCVDGRVAVVIGRDAG
jgi:hypothetical protein